MLDSPLGVIPARVANAVQVGFLLGLLASCGEDVGPASREAVTAKLRGLAAASGPTVYLLGDSFAGERLTNVWIEENGQVSFVYGEKCTGGFFEKTLRTDDRGDK